MRTSESYEGSGSTTYVLPAGRVNDGVLIAPCFLRVTDAADNKGQQATEAGHLPEFLEIKQDGTLEFSGELSETIIRVIGEMLVIHTAGGC